MQSKKRGLGGAGSPPLMVAVIPLEEGQVHKMEALLQTLLTCSTDLQVRYVSVHLNTMLYLVYLFIKRTKGAYASSQPVLPTII